MIIDLFSFEGSSIEFEFSLAPSEIRLESETAKLKRDVRVSGELTKKLVQTDVSGKIFAALEIECTRCLQAIEKDLEISFNVIYVTAENYTEAKEAELRDEDLDVSIFDGNKIDARELVREQIILSLPEQIYCSEDCKGLCAKCGADRNWINCNCEEKEIDPRWQSLRELNIKNEK